MRERKERVVVSVVETVANYKNEDVSALPPLERSIDPDALERLFAPTAAGPRAGIVEFQYAGCIVRISRSPKCTITVADELTRDTRSSSSSLKELDQE